jgi:hypothetical protein
VTVAPVGVKDERSYFTLKITIFRVGDGHQVEVSHTDPGSDAQVTPLRGPASFDLAELLSRQARPEDYGQELSRQLFGAAGGEVRVRFLEVSAAAQKSDSFLRLSLSVDPSARELQSLRWELLRHPDTNAALHTSERVLLSRFMVSRDHRPVKVRARAALTALVAVSAPAGPQMEKLQKMKVAPVDFAGEVARAKGALAGMKEVRTLGGPGNPFTVDRLIEELRRDVDVLYLVSHGMFSASEDKASLILQDETGDARRVGGEELAAPLGDLPVGPRLVVLASCQSAGDGEQVDAARPAAQATLAARLADCGVPAVVAMQGFISMATVEKMMPVFFSELLTDGQIDRALAAARGKVRDRDDAWMPALSIRLTSGRLWYTPGFQGQGGQAGDSSGQAATWRLLVSSVSQGKVVPILGPRLLEPVHGLETARRLAEATGFPFAAHEWDDLPRVSQYIATSRQRFNMVVAYRDQLISDLIARHKSWLPASELPPQKKPALGALLKLVGEHLRQTGKDGPGYAYDLLAALPAPVYLTTTFDALLEQALEANQKTPYKALTRWRHRQKPADEPAQGLPEPTAKAPLVYHAFGAFGPDTEGSLVLTEDNYFDYLITSAAYQLMPDAVAAPLCASSILFLGFRLTDWHFRVLFRLLMNLEGRAGRSDFCHVAVQLDPDTQTMADVERGKRYLADYFHDADKIQIYWGTAEEFLRALHDEIGKQGREGTSGDW